MNILVIEDDRNKESHLRDLLSVEFPDATLKARRSYQSGLVEAEDWMPDLLILDMSMPTYDVTPTESGEPSLPFGGEDILRELDRKNVPSRVVVVTQYDTFGTKDNMVTLDQLKQRLGTNYPRNFIGTVFYHPAQTGWKNELLAILVKLKERERK